MHTGALEGGLRGGRLAARGAAHACRRAVATRVRPVEAPLVARGEAVVEVLVADDADVIPAQEAELHAATAPDTPSLLYTRIGRNRGNPQSTNMQSTQSIHSHSDGTTAPSR